VAVASGESLDSWLEALARRNGLTITELLPSVGWQAPRWFGRLVMNVPAPVLREIEHQTGLPSGRLDDAVLDRYLPAMPVRRAGSRYCPGCLADNGGRWLLAWRLPWVFACTGHNTLLCGACPRCGKVPRVRYGAAGPNPAGSCLAIQAGTGNRCAADLRDVPRRQLTRDGPVLAAQHWINTILGLADEIAPVLGLADEIAPVCSQQLSALIVVAHWALRRFSASDFASFGDDVYWAWQKTGPEAAGRLSRSGGFPPASAALTAAAAAAGHAILEGDDGVAIARIRALLGPRPTGSRAVPIGMTSQRWIPLPRPVQARFLRALDPVLPPAERIRHRSGTSQASLPSDSAGLLQARARRLPQALWPGWTIRLMPAEGFRLSLFRSSIAACLLLPGNLTQPPGPVAELFAYRSKFAVNGVLRSLVARNGESALVAICCLAAYLDAYGGPVDYRRRRALIPAEVISQPEWHDLCGRAGAHPGRPGGRSGEIRRLLDARRYLYQLLTGADLQDPRHPLAFRTGLDLSRYYEFTDPMGTSLRAALHDHARALLDRLGIDEPVTWEPPPDCCRHLDLPGRDPDEISLQAVEQLVISQELPVGHAAQQLGTTSYHVRFALECVPRPGRQWTRSTPPAAWARRQQAPNVLTREFFEREYLRAGKTLHQVAAETGFSRPLVAEHARQAGISLTPYSPPTADIDPDWLREQYHGRRRPYADIAAELGVSVMAVRDAAQRHGIRSRPPGVYSFPEMMTKVGTGTPSDIRRAVNGGLRGWHRLRRFQIAMTFPTVKDAAAHIGTHPSALVHQFERLERDIGGRLYHRGAPGQPARPTSRGAELLGILARPEIQALAIRHAPDVAGPGDRSGGYRGRMSGLAERADAKRAARLFRALAEPTRLAILLALQAGERRNVDLGRELGVSEATISSHLANLKECGLITGRPQGRAVYYRIAHPELAPLMAATEQLLIAAGQPAGLHGPKDTG
jgi:DNA-binding transcriptional ArsR family regulator